ncbi:MAG: transposase [Pyrinomonadaceae bacterium]|nr:transposase [Pyrinomonadaceae bacterium]
MNRELLELYSDYLLSAFSHTTATGLSRMTNGIVSHDKITRFLSDKELNSAELWHLVKPLVREIEDGASGVLIIDDTIEEKPYTELESELVCWHYDHSKGRNVKGINLLSTLYQVGDLSVPVAFELVKKSEWVFNKKKDRWQRKSPLTKNEHYRRMLEACAKNRIGFRYVLNDVWYASSENMRHVKEELEKEFIMPIKTNRKVALSLERKKRGEYEQVASVELEPGTVVEVHVEQVEFPLLLVKQVFKNEEDGSEGVLYLVSSDVTLDYEQLTTIYQRRWKVEEYHKSLKSNASLAKSPTKTIRTQSNHCFASIYAFVKLERLKMATSMNHFALRSRMYLKAVRAAFGELQTLRVPGAELGSCVR